jgi:hypothetical protein
MDKFGWVEHSAIENAGSFAMQNVLKTRTCVHEADASMLMVDHEVGLEGRSIETNMI